MHVAFDPAIPLLRIYSTDILVHMLNAISSDLFVVLLHNRQWLETTQNLSISSG